MRDYGVVHSSFWSSQTTAGGSDDSKLLALYLMTSQHSTIAGVFRLPDGYVAEDLQWALERVQQAFAELLANGFVNRCETTKWVWVCKHLKWNPPDNPNQRKAASKVALSVPDECCWKRDFMRVCGPLFGLESPDQTSPSPTVDEPIRNQNQEQNQEQDQKYKTSPSDEGPRTGPQLLLVDSVATTPPGPYEPPECPHLEVLALWAEVLPALPQHKPSLWKNARAAHLRARWRDQAIECKWAAKDDGLRWFRRFFEYVGQSPFLTGQGKSSDPARPPFQIELEWLVEAGNFVKVIEGKYHREVAA